MEIVAPHGEPKSTQCSRPGPKEAAEAGLASVGSMDKAGSRLSPHEQGS